MVGPFTKPVIRLGALAIVCIAALLGAFYLYGRGDSEPAAATAGARPDRQAQQTTAAPVDEPAVPTDAARDQIVALLGDARRMADDGKFDQAQVKLAAAEQAAPGLPEIAQMRRKIADMATPENQFVLQIDRGKSAVNANDWAAAEQAVAAAERLKPQAPEIAELRESITAETRKRADLHERVATLLTRMREAIARRDFAAADSALNAAARLNVRDPTLDAARVELARAHDERAATTGR